MADILRSIEQDIKLKIANTYTERKVTDTLLSALHILIHVILSWWRARGRIWARTLGVDRGEAKLYMFLQPIGMCGEKIGWGQSNVYAKAISLSGCSLPLLCLSIHWIKCSSWESSLETLWSDLSHQSMATEIKTVFLEKGNKRSFLWMSKSSLMFPERDTTVIWALQEAIS